MRKEIEAASIWWTSQLNTNVAPLLTKEQISSFQSALTEILEEKYTKHWYVEEPERGSAFRSISFDNRTVDHVLLEAAQRSKIPNIRSRLSNEVIMWVDPELIQVQYTHSPKRHVIYGKSFDLLMDPSVLRGAAIFPRPKSLITDEQNRTATTVNM